MKPRAWTGTAVDAGVLPGLGLVTAALMVVIGVAGLSQRQRAPSQGQVVPSEPVASGRPTIDREQHGELKTATFALG
jgi:hypothetical protein